MDYEDDEAFEEAYWRFRLGQFECMMSQTVQDFDIVIRSQERHFDKLISLGKKFGMRIKPYLFTGDPLVMYNGVLRTHPYPSEYIQSETKYLDKYHIQTLLDYDDWFSPNFIEKIEHEFKGKTKKHVLNFMPVKVDIVNLEIYKMNYYRTGKGSMFLSLFCPDLNDYTLCWTYRHLALPKSIGSSTIIPEGYCWYVIHNHNTGNARKKSNTVQLPLCNLIAKLKD
jgi:hypothetical protein